jgi:hypothetical protein
LKDLCVICAMEFDPPAAYDTVERFSDQTAEGAVKEKNISFTLADGTVIGYAWAADMDLEGQVGSRDVENEEIGDHKVYFMQSSNVYRAFFQHGADVYGVQYSLPETDEAAEGDETAESAESTDGKALLKECVAALRFKEEAAACEAADLGLFDITCAPDETLKISGHTVTEVCSAAGELQKKSVTWKYGEDFSSPDFRLLIRVFRGETLQDLLKEDKEYEEKTVGDITYTVLKADEGTAPYEYYVQHGEDVYEIRNNGNDSGWFVSRPEESVQAFEAFVNSISFK